MKVGGSGLVGAALLGPLVASSGCEGESAEGSTRLLFSHGEDNELLNRQILRFNDQHRGEIEVELRLAPADTGQYFEELRTGFQTGDAKADVISGDVIWPAQFAAAGWISDLSPLFGEDLRSDHLPAAVGSNVHEGGVYGVPWFTDAGLLYYREDLLEATGFSGPPETWEDLEEQALKVTRDRGIPNGYVFQGAEYEGGVVNGLEFIWNSGGGVLDPALERVVVDEPEAVGGLRAARGMVEDGISPNAVPSYKEYESFTVFLAGDAVFMRNWPNVYARAADPSQSDVEQERIGVAPLPTARAGTPAFSGLGGWNLMVNAASDDKTDAAWEFIRYLSAPEQQMERALDGGYLPTLGALYENDEVLRQVPVIALGREAIRNTRPRPATPFYNDMSRAMARHFHASLMGAASPERAAAMLAGELEDILQRAQVL